MSLVSRLAGWFGALGACRASLEAQLVKNPPALQESWVRSLGWEDPLEKKKATHSRILAWRIQRTICGPWGRKESDTTEWLSLHGSVSVSCQPSPRPLISPVRSLLTGHSLAQTTTQGLPPWENLNRSLVIGD